jgi:hypothetical protein
MPNNGKAYQYSAVRGGMTTAKTAPKATVEPSTTIHLGPRVASSPIDDSMGERRLRPDFAGFINIRGRTSSDRNRFAPEASRVTRLSGAQRAVRRGLA